MGGGGPGKAAEPKVTPFVDYSAQTPEIPNWFADRQATGTSFTPDFSQSKSAFGASAPQPAPMPAAPMPSAPAQMPQQAPVNPQPMPMGSPTPFTSSASPVMQKLAKFAMHGTQEQSPPMRFGIPTAFGGGFPFGNLQQFLSPETWQMLQRFSGGFGGFSSAPRYTNYTDTNPADSTGPQGPQNFMPRSIWGGFFNGGR